jgi:hypothetical protein
MKKIKIIFVLGALFCIFLSCHTKIDKTESTLTIPIQEENFEKKRTKLSSLIKVVELIPLETNNDCLIGKINKIIISKNRIYILDKNRAKSVFVFNRKGQFVNKIASNGKGPMDILEPADIISRPSTNELLILDGTLGKINTYNEDGEFRETLPLKFHPTHFEAFGTNKYIFATQYPYLLTITDLKGKILSNSFKYEADFQRVLMKPIISYNNELYFLRFMDNTIYRINEENVESGIFIDYGKHALTRKAYLDIPLSGMDRLIEEKYMYNISSLRINKAHIFFKFNFANQAVINILNRENGRLFSIPFPKIEDDLFYGGADILWISNTFNDLFIGIIEPNKMNPISPILYNEIKYQFSIDNNPAIILYDFKIN